MGWWDCPVCGNRLHVKLSENELAVRCVRCRASAVSESIIGVLVEQLPALDRYAALELSSRGVLAGWLRNRVASLQLSEWMPDHPLGAIIDGVRNEDVQRLTFANASFDLVTSTEVFEHVADDARGFSEVHRVLRPGGAFVFTVPLMDRPDTHERARLHEGRIEHVDTPEYHDDSFAGTDRVLCFRNYGLDIVDRLCAAGFERVRIVTPSISMLGHARRVLVARKTECMRDG
ncbi:hypothetical protein LF63_0101105 [Oleiagrimonas soli]|uniref:Methyltransferase type 11 domain-containing protein n=1 Tax=Oleiagrimonas soli TaxID=1543381 RepID=A0A099CZM2_9GAMM|nr:hypothetical protein LF63_0101105 [Oleiagrimonas soli]